MTMRIEVIEAAKVSKKQPVVRHRLLLQVQQLGVLPLVGDEPGDVAVQHLRDEGPAQSGVRPPGAVRHQQVDQELAQVGGVPLGPALGVAGEREDAGGGLSLNFRVLLREEEQCVVEAAVQEQRFFVDPCLVGPLSIW
eukprot:CAMPEP_0194601918 /NCGR_PEP_ID=MMETSP0292-20121207/29332_1 /TAXON_ID=39354 /ORGANISM="Heterosigma akashiwo, Strain CCMP2393" /LENGTH=137 /DNA_ID=CAMNT_0039464045 /DNA_START=41 /DNA_END=451 /DNA_ORIENTATION=+